MAKDPMDKVDIATGVMERNVKSRIDDIHEVGKREGMGEIATSVGGVLASISSLASTVSKGTRAITLATAIGAKEAIAQYSRAISEDISFNKQNVVAMALAKTTPLYGYFVSKFMETDIFKKFGQKVRNLFTAVFQGIFSRLKKFLTIFGIGKGIMLAAGGGIPTFQKGGVVGKTGIAKVHKGETVVPFEKMTRYQQMQVKIMQGELAREKKSRWFFKKARGAWEEATEEAAGSPNLPPMEQLVKLTRRLVLYTTGSESRWRLFFKNWLGKHPIIKKLFTIVGWASKVITVPYKFLFKKRGGYEADLPKGGHEGVFAQIGGILGTLYVGMMYQLDALKANLRAIVESTRDTATMLTGKKYSPVNERLVTRGRMISTLWGGLKSMGRYLWGGLSYYFPGLSKITDFFKGDKIFEFFRRQKEKVLTLFGKGKWWGKPEAPEEKKRGSLDAVVDILTEIKDILHTSGELAHKDFRGQLGINKFISKYAKKTAEATEETADKVDKLQKGGKSWLGKIFTWLMMAGGSLFGFLKGIPSLLGKVLRSVLPKELVELFDLLKLGGRKAGGAIWRGAKYIPKGLKLGLKGLGRAIPALGRFGRGAMGVLRGVPGALGLGQGVAGAARLAGLVATPLIAAGLTIFRASQAQEKYGDVIGEKLSMDEKLGLGAGGALKDITFGLVDVEKWMGVDKAKKEAEEAYRKQKESVASFYEKMKAQTSEKAWQFFLGSGATPDNFLERWSQYTQVVKLVKYDPEKKLWVLAEEYGEAPGPRERADMGLDFALQAAQKRREAELEAQRLKSEQLDVQRNIPKPGFPRRPERTLTQKVGETLLGYGLSMKDIAEASPEKLKAELEYRKRMEAQKGPEFTRAYEVPTDVIEKYINAKETMAAARERAQEKASEYAEKAKPYITEIRENLKERATKLPDTVETARAAAADFLVQTDPMLRAAGTAISEITTGAKSAINVATQSINNTVQNTNAQTIASGPTTKAGPYDRYAASVSGGEL